MKELANSGDWSIRVPTMVVIELEHLAEKDVARFWTVEEVDLSKVWNISAQPTLYIFVSSRIWRTVRNRR